MGVTNYYSVEGDIQAERAGTGARTDYLCDALGSVTGTSDSSGAVVNTYRHKPYGTQLAKAGAGADPNFQWVGTSGYRMTSLSHSSHYVRARHYAQEHGTWTTVDPLWPNQLPYSYAYGNPVTVIDFAGLLSCPRTDCGMSDEEACDWERINRSDEVAGKDGITICCGSKPIGCVFNKKLPAWPEAIRRCTQVHEQSHVDHDCSCVGNVGIKGCKPSSPSAGHHGECVAYSAEVDCLTDALKKCPGGIPGAVCSYLLTKRICSACLEETLECKHEPINSKCYNYSTDWCKSFLK